VNQKFLELTSCLDAPQKLEFFHSLSITSIFGPMHEVVNVGKKITKAVFRSIEKCTMQKKIPRHIKLAIHAWSAKCG
jgi:hypothetical protein